MTLHDVQRICKAHELCETCPLYCYEKLNCILTSYATPQDYDIARIQKSCYKWLKEHPEPVYPTYYNWLTSEGVYDFGERISEEFAEKHNIKPIE